MSMEITINIVASGLEAAINNLAAAMELKEKALGSASKVLDKSETIEVAERLAKKNTSEKEEKLKTGEQKPETINEKTTYTIVQVREKLASLSRAGKQAQVKALIEKFGATKLSEIKEEDYAALMQEAEGL